MRLLVLGGGGREHALIWALARSAGVEAIFAAPGNAGIAELATCVPLDPADGEAVAEWARGNGIGLVVIGPEAPLAAGVADRLHEAGVPAFGPSAGAARLESSKAFAKAICDACGAPTAAWARFDEPEAAKAHVAGQRLPLVVKADGLAAGKGVVIAATAAEAESAIDAMFGGGFGEAGRAVVIEEFMEGEEASFFVLSDGRSVLPLATAQDHKRAHDGDTGPNTGGMGAYSPAPVMTEAVQRQALERIVRPTIAEMRARGLPYRGVLYAGLMVGADGPRLVEYNVRFGDPEWQALVLRLGSDLLPALMACAQGTLDRVRLDWRPEPALTVVLAAEGYPGAVATGRPVQGIKAAAEVPGVTVFHAGTAREDDALVSTGGRVLNVSAVGATLGEARDRAYEALGRIELEGGFYRRDIGWRALEGAAGGRG
jgi:phosphoribosylamine---glycine ligase